MQQAQAMGRFKGCSCLLLLRYEASKLLARLGLGCFRRGALLLNFSLSNSVDLPGAQQASSCGLPHILSPDLDVVDVHTIRQAHVLHEFLEVLEDARANSRDLVWHEGNACCQLVGGL